MFAQISRGSLPFGHIVARRCFSGSPSCDIKLKELVVKAAKTKHKNGIKTLQVAYKAAREQRPTPKQTLSNKATTNGPITRQHAAHLLEKITGTKVDMHSLGPLSNADVQYLRVPDKRIVHAILGTTPNQLLDSIIVDNSVKSFLQRGQIEKALMMAKLAKDNGKVAMNRITEWYLRNNKINDALKIHSCRKKWGVPTNNHSLTILFDGCSKFRGVKGEAGLTIQQAEKLRKILLNLKSGYKFEPNLIHINSGLSAILNCEDQTIGFELWEDWSKKTNPFLKQFKPDTRTYTILLDALAHSKNDIWVVINAELLLEKILKLPDHQQDKHLFQAYVYAYTRCKRIDLIQRGLVAAGCFFDIETKVATVNFNHKNVQPIQEKFDSLNKLEPLKHKMIPTSSLIDILMRTYNTLGAYNQSLEIYRQFEEKQVTKIDLSLIHRYFISSRETDRSNAGTNAISRYRDLENGKYPIKINLGSTLRFIVFDSIYTESLSKLNDKGLFAIGKEADHIFEISNEFLSHIEHIAGAQELSGYVKSLRRLRLTKDQRFQVMNIIDKFKPKLQQELKATSNYKTTKLYIDKINDFETHLKSKHEKKLILETLDRQNMSFKGKSLEN